MESFALGKLRCECGAQLEAKNVNVAAALATCTSCGSVFSIAQPTPAENVLRPTPRVVPTSITPRESLGAEARPGAYREASSGDGARWTFRWFRWPYALMLLFFLFWDAVCGVFVVTGMAGGGFGLFTLLLPHVWIGVIGSYWVLAHLFNRSTLTLTSQSLVVRNGPIPWPSKSIARETISTFEAQKSWGNNGQEQYQLRVIDREKRPARVLGAITEEEARYLADALNTELENRG